MQGNGLKASLVTRINRLLDFQFLGELALSKQAKISLSFLGHIGCGTRKMSAEILYALCKALDCRKTTGIFQNGHFRTRL